MSDVPITNDISESIVAQYFDSNGNTIELDVQTTITRLPKYSRSINEPDRYSVTAYVSGDQKVETGSGTSDNSNILATGSLTMVWIDGKGADTFNNVIERIYGSWTTPNPDSTKFKEGTINWGKAGTVLTRGKKVPQNFDENINYIDNMLAANSNGYFEKTVNGSVVSGRVRITLAPSIFD